MIRKLRRRRHRSVRFDETQPVTGWDLVCGIDTMRLIFFPPSSIEPAATQFVELEHARELLDSVVKRNAESAPCMTRLGSSEGPWSS